MSDNSKDNMRVIEAVNDPAKLNRFLTEEQQHIIRLTSKITHSSVTTSDDEWAIALYAAAKAIETYDISKGDFWSYAAVVIRNRLNDHYRKKTGNELLVSPEMFAGGAEPESPEAALQKEVVSKTSVHEDNTLKHEIEAITDELAKYDISFFDLAACSPKAGKTREACQSIIKAILEPPPLTEEIKKKGVLPIKALSLRCSFSTKLTDRYRKYIMAAAMILDGDYPGISSYLNIG